MTAKKTKKAAKPTPKKKAAAKKPSSKPKASAAKKTGRKGVTGPKTPSAALRHRMRLLDYMADPDNPPLNRSKLAELVLKVNRKTLYKTFTPADLAEIEAEGLSLRRARLSTTSAQVDASLVRQALDGDVSAIKLYYQRFEGFSEKSTVAVEPSLDDLRALAIAKGFEPEEYIATYFQVRSKGGRPE